MFVTQKTSKARRPWWHGLPVNLSLALGTLLFCGLLGEAAVRCTLKRTMGLFPRYHTDAQYGDFTIRRLRPDTVFSHTTFDGTWQFRTNRQGYRNDADFNYEKPQGTVRVLALGDSHTEGFEVRQEYTHSAALERILRKQGTRAEVYNTGVSGFGTAEELVFLENEGVKYHPDYVVLGYFANDPEDNLKAGLYTVKDGALQVEKKSHIPGVSIQNFIYRFGFMRWLGEHSYLYSLVFNAVWDHYKILLTLGTTEKTATEYAIPTQNLTDVSADLTARLIARMNEVCRAHGAKLIHWRARSPPGGYLSDSSLSGVSDDSPLLSPTRAAGAGRK